MPRSASLIAIASFTPSPVIATVWPSSCSTRTIARFWSGVTRPKMLCSASAARISASPCSSPASCDDVPTPRPFARADTVVGLSPEMMMQRTACSLKYCSVDAASGPISSPNSSTAAGWCRAAPRRGRRRPGVDRSGGPVRACGVPRPGVPRRPQPTRGASRTTAPERRAATTTAARLRGTRCRCTGACSRTARARRPSRRPRGSARAATSPSHSRPRRVRSTTARPPSPPRAPRSGRRRDRRG